MGHPYVHVLDNDSGELASMEEIIHDVHTIYLASPCMLIQAAAGQVHLSPSVYLFGKSIFHGMIFDAVAVLWLFLFRDIFTQIFRYY